MNPRSTAVLEITGVALATAAIGLAAVSWSSWGSTAGVAVASTSLSVLVALVTKGISLFATAQLSTGGEADRAAQLREREFLAFSKSQDYLSLLDELLRKEQFQGRVEPPDIAVHAISEVKTSSQVLATLGKVEQAYAVDEKLRFLLDSHGSVSWLWFVSRFEDRAPDAVTHDVRATDEAAIRVDDDSDTRERP